MEVFYDLSLSPATHDIVYFLARAEMLRKQMGEKHLQVRIVDGDRLITPRDKIYTHERKQWRIQNLLFPVCQLLPSVNDVSMGNGKQTIPYSTFGKPIDPIFKAPEVAKSIVSAIIDKYPNPVTISIRQADFEAIRNSRFKEWTIVAGWLKDRGFTPIFIPDIEAELIGKSFENEFPVYRPAAYNHSIRLALYEMSIVNLMTSGGPWGTAMLAEVPMMAFKLITPSLFTCTLDYMKKIGLSPDSDWGPHKKLYAEQDMADYIIPELEKHMPMFCERKRPVYQDIYKLRAR